jgi:hypothetical protein
MPRHDDRYEATPEDVLHVLRYRDPDPFNYNETPQTDFTIASKIVSEKGLRGHPLGRIIKRGKLVMLLEEMARDGRLVVKTAAEWSDLGRERHSRSKTPLYTTPERAAAWGISIGISQDRWALTVVFDDLETQTAADPELIFPGDECSSLIGFIGDHWGLLPEQVQEIAEWTPTRVVLQLESLEFVSTVTNWLGFHTVPQSITITRNENR